MEKTEEAGLVVVVMDTSDGQRSREFRMEHMKLKCLWEIQGEISGRQFGISRDLKRDVQVRDKNFGLVSL